MDFKFPDVGEGITEGRLVKWLVKLGDSIKQEQAVASIETDKAVVEIPSPVSGVVEKLVYNPGDVVYVGKTMMTINESGSSNIKIEAPKQEEKVEAPKKTTSKKIVQNNNDNNANNSNNNSNGQVLAMPAVRKAARIKGINLSNVKGSGQHGQILLSDINVKLSDITGVQTIQYSYMSAPIKASTTSINTEQSSFNNKSYSDVLATPSTKQLARELNVDLTQVKGTGSNGSITRDDVLAYGKNTSSTSSSNIVSSSSSNIAASASQAVSSNQIAIPIAGKSSSNNYGETVVVPFTPVRNAIYKHMIESKNNVPHFTISDDVDVTDLYNFREKYKEHYEKLGVKLTYLPFIIHAVIDGLVKHPYLNSSINDTSKELILKKYYNIGIATDTPDGLMVPVLKNSDKKHLLDVAKDISELSTKAREHRLSLEELSGGTFTISSLGNSFGQMFTPIINYPETAILGVGRIVDKAVVLNNVIVQRKMVTLSLSCDHRIIDGAEASRFMNDVKWHIENFEDMLMH